MQALFGVRSFKDREGTERAVWTRIGTAFPCKDGSWNLVVDYLPLQAGTTTNMRPLSTQDRGTTEPTPDAPEAGQA
jgi:hypothetical protein